MLPTGPSGDKGPSRLGSAAKRLSWKRGSPHHFWIPEKFPEKFGRYVGVSKNRGTPKWMVKTMENLIKMDDLGEKNVFLETPMSLPRHPMFFFFDLFNILCFFRSVYHHIPRRFLAGVSFLEPASVTRYPRSSMLLAWLVLRETVLVFFGLLFLLAGFFWVKKNSLLFWRWSMLYLS